MSKFRIRMKLTGFELEVEGTREDVPLIAQSLGRQLTGLLEPASQIVDGELLPNVKTASPALSTNIAQDSTNRRKPRRRAVGVAGTGVTGANERAALDWRHDPQKYGTPRQEWSSSQKILFTLYVAGQETGVGDMTTGQIRATFNKHFRQAGQLLRQNMSRDLAKLKAGRKGEQPEVSEDTTKNPATWFLTEAGTRGAQQLVTAALNQTS